MWMTALTQRSTLDPLPAAYSCEIARTAGKVSESCVANTAASKFDLCCFAGQLQPGTHQRLAVFRVHVVCRQLRLRDAFNVKVSLLCRTQPVIESSKNVQFCCWQLGYWGLRGQMEAAQISPFHNFWSDVHDFSRGKSGWDFAAEHDMRWPGLLRCKVPTSVMVGPSPNSATCPGSTSLAHVSFVYMYPSRLQQSPAGHCHGNGALCSPKVGFHRHPQQPVKHKPGSSKCRHCLWYRKISWM